MEDLLSEFFDSIEAVETVELLANPSLLTRPRVYRERPDFFTQYDDKDFFSRYRLSKDCVIFLLQKLEHILEYPDDRNKSVPPIKQLLCALRFYATGSQLLTIADMGGISTATCSRIVKRVSEAIVTLRQEFIIFPETEQDQLRVKEEFYKIAHCQLYLCGPKAISLALPCPRQ